MWLYENFSPDACRSLHTRHPWTLKFCYFCSIHLTCHVLEFWCRIGKTEHWHLPIFPQLSSHPLLPFLQKWQEICIISSYSQTFPVSQIPLALGGIPSPLFLGPNGDCYKETFEIVPCHIFSKCFLYPCCKMNILLDETLLTFRKLLGEGPWTI